METGLDPWVDHEETLGEKMPEDILMNDTGERALLN
jgi:hypothetical protein